MTLSNQLQALAFYLTLLLEKYFPNKEVSPPCLKYLAGTVDVLELDNVPKGLLERLTKDFQNLISGQESIDIYEMVPSSAIGYLKEKFPDCVYDELDISQKNTLVCFAEYNGKLYFAPTGLKEIELNKLVVDLFHSKNKDGVRFYITTAENSKSLQDLKAYFPAHEKSYKTLGQQMKLWDEDGLVYPKGRTIVEEAKRLVESEKSQKYAFLEHLDPKTVQKISEKAGYPILMAWGLDDVPDLYKNFYCPEIATNLDAMLISDLSKEPENLISSLQFNCRIIKIFGFSSKFYLRLAKRSKSKRCQASDHETNLKKALEASGCDFSLIKEERKAEPQIESYFVDHVGREWPLGFLKRCDQVEHSGALMYHHRLMTGIEMLLNLSIEKYKGMLPSFLNPEQVRIIPVSERQFEAADRVCKLLKLNGINVALDLNFQRLQNRILIAERQFVPFFALLGEQEEKKGCIAVRPRKGKKTLYMSAEELADMLKKEKNYF